MSLGISLYNLENLENVVDIRMADNPRGLAVVYESSSATKESQQFLEKVLSAVSLSPEEVVHIIRKEAAPASLSSSEIWTSGSKLIFFGVWPADLGIHYAMEPYRPLQVQERTILHADEIPQIAQDAHKKKALWTALQQMFPDDV